MRPCTFKYPYCGGRKCPRGVVAMAGQFAKIWHPFLWRIPHQQELGNDCCTLFPKVTFTSTILLLTPFQLTEPTTKHFFPSLYSPHFRPGCVYGKAFSRHLNSEWGLQPCFKDHHSSWLQFVLQWQWHCVAAIKNLCELQWLYQTSVPGRSSQ